MRRVLFSDVSAAARVLVMVPAASRERLCMHLFEQADWADRFVRRLGRLHPTWGNGTLRDAAMQYRSAPAPGFDNMVFCACFELVLHQLCRRKKALEKKGRLT